MRLFRYSQLLNCIKYNENGQWGQPIEFFLREIFALQRNMLQMRLVTTSFRFRSRGTSRAADRRRPASAASQRFSSLVADATNIFSRKCYTANVEEHEGEISPSFLPSGIFSKKFMLKTFAMMV